MFDALFTIPLHIICQLVVVGNNGTNNAMVLSAVDPQSLMAQGNNKTTDMPAPFDVGGQPRIAQENATTNNTIPVAEAPSVKDCDKQAIATEPPEQTRVLPEGYTPIFEIGAAYKYHSTVRTWNAARKYCIADGGYLAEIDSFEKIAHAMGLKDSSRNLHVGIHRYFNHNEWTSIKTGLSITKIPWAPESNIKKRDHDCLRMWYDGRGLTANDCNYELHYICEIPLESIGSK